MKLSDRVAIYLFIIGVSYGVYANIAKVLLFFVLLQALINRIARGDKDFWALFFNYIGDRTEQKIKAKAKVKIAKYKHKTEDLKDRIMLEKLDDK